MELARCEHRQPVKFVAEVWALQLDQDFLSKKISTFIELSPMELDGLASLQSITLQIERGHELVHQGETEHVAHIVKSGWGCSFKILRDGSRQIITFPVPGDVIGLRSVLLRTSDHAFTAVTDTSVCRISVNRLTTLFDEYPRLGTAIMWATSRDEAITVEHLASIGRRTALERTAHFFLELRDRLDLVGLASAAHYECPLNQYEIADALGLSAIHVNRVLRQLRELNLMTFQEHVVEIHDVSGMADLAGYDRVEPR
jgi:CRP-like cAMP-binding protein